LAASDLGFIIGASSGAAATVLCCAVCLYACRRRRLLFDDQEEQDSDKQLVVGNPSEQVSLLCLPYPFQPSTPLQLHFP